MIKSNTKRHNYGRFVWTMKYPSSYEEIIKARDEEIIKWWRFLPPAQNDSTKKVLLNSVVEEFNKRFKTPVEVAAE